MDSFNSFAGVPPPFGLTDLDRLAYQNLIWQAWVSYAKYEARQRELQLAAAQASAPALAASPVAADASVQASPPEPPATISDYAQHFSEQMGGATAPDSTSTTSAAWG